jgi:hypothetical protein
MTPEELNAFAEEIRGQRLEFPLVFSAEVGDIKVEGNRMAINFDGYGLGLQAEHIPAEMRDFLVNLFHENMACLTPIIAAIIVKRLGESVGLEKAQEMVHEQIMALRSGPSDNVETKWL